MSKILQVFVLCLWMCQTVAVNPQSREYNPIPATELDDPNYDGSDIAEEGAVTMAFVFDITGSMYDDLVQVIDGAAKILDTALQRKERLLHNYVLVPFHDPDVGPATVTTDHRVFQEHLKNLYVQGGGDCPEASIAAIKLALEFCLPNSFIYVFTDASSKDYHLLQDVLTLIQRKQSQVIFVMTGDCGDPDHPGYQAYETIASTSSGQVFHLKKSDVDEVLNFVRVSLQARKVNLLAVNQEGKGEAVLPIDVDSNLREFTVSLSGDNPQVQLINPNGTVIKDDEGAKQILNIPNVRVVNIKDPEFGTWNVKLSSNSSHTIRATGLSPVDFVYGFSVMPTTNLLETYHRPLKGAPTHLLINATDLAKGAYFDSIEIIGLGGESLLNVSLEKDSQPGIFKAVTPFVPPHEYFYLRIRGFDELEFPMQRISPTAISSQLPGLPEVTVRPVTDIHHGNTVSLVCKIQSLVSFEVGWFRGNNSDTLLGSLENHLQTSTITFTISNISSEHEDVYICNATNIAGSASAQVYLNVRDPPPKMEKIADSTIAPGSSAVFHCRASSNSPFNLTWSRYDSSSTRRRFTTELIKANPRFIGFSNGTLVIHNVLKDDEGWYRCTARNEGGSAHQRMYVSVHKAPIIKINPSSDITYVEGSSGSITCESSGIPEPAVEWLRSGQRIADSPHLRAIGGTLQLHHATRALAGSYECRAHNAAGTDSKTVQLKYIVPPKIDKSQNVYKVILGEPITLSCNTNLAIPAARIQWRRGDDLLPKRKSRMWSVNPTVIRGDLPAEEHDADEYDDDQFELIDGSRLRFHPQIADGGEYICEVVNEAGNDQHIVSVMVLDPPYISPFNKDLVLVKRGDSVTLPCSTTGYPAPVVTWLKDGNLVLIEKDAKKVDPRSDREGTRDVLFEGLRENLNLENVGLAASGFYSCVAKNEAGEATFNYTVIVQDPPKISDSNPRRIEAILGETALLDCKSSGHPPPLISWKKSGVLLDPSTLVLFTNGSLVLETVVSEDAGMFTCSASNEAGYDHLDIEVVLLVPPSVNTSVLQKHTEVFLENSVILNCPIIADPLPTITWSKNGVIIGQNLAEKDHYYVRNNGMSLIIPKAKSTDSGDYDCIAVNTAGQRNVTLTLDVLHAPDFIENDYDKDIIVNENGIMELDCLAAGNPKPIVSWFYNGHPLTPNGDTVVIRDGVLSIPNLQESDAGYYTCHVGNKVGTSVRRLDVTVFVAPKVQGQDYETYQVLLGQSIDLLCHAKGNPPPSIIWLQEDLLLDTPSEKVQFKDSNRVLQLLEVEETDAGEYVCEVENPAGATSKTILLVVLVPPVISLQGVDSSYKKKIFQKADFEVECLTTGNPQPVLTWMKDGIIINESFGHQLSLRLQSIDASEAGRYICSASNSAGQSERDIAIEVLVPPFIEGEDDSSDAVDIQQILSGVPIVLHCQAGGAPLPEIDWYRTEGGVLRKVKSDNNVVMIDGGKKLRIAQPTIEDAGLYSCIAVNEAGGAEKKFEIVVLVPPTIKKEENENDTDSSIIKAILNRKVILHCPVSSGHPPPEVSWLKNGKQISPSGDPNVEINSVLNQLVINTVQAETAGGYTCLVKNAAGSAEKEFLVNVVSPPEIDVYLDKLDKNPTVLLSRPVTLSCPIKLAFEQTIFWKKDGKIIANGDDSNVVITADGQKLKIHRSKEDDRGRYTCMASNEAGETKVDFDLDVQVPPKLLKTDKTKSKIIATENSSIIVECPVDGHPVPVITWLKDGHLLSENAFNDIYFEDDNRQLVIRRLMLSHGGLYTCVASNEVGVVEQNYNVVVQVPPKLDAKDLDQRPSVSLHRPFTITCPVSGTPPPAVKWFKDGKPLHQIRDSNVYVMADGRRLKLRRARVEDAGTYKCVAYNDAGKTEQEYVLTVQVPPSFKTEENDDENTSQNPEAVEGGTADIYCKVNGIPEPTIIWLKDGRLVGLLHTNYSAEELLEANSLLPGFINDQPPNRFDILYNGRLLRIHNVEVDDGGLYTCIASNTAGSVERNFDLEVLVPPKITGAQKESPRVLLNRPIILECPVEAIPPSSIAWLKDGQPIKVRALGGALIRIPNGGRQLHISRTQEMDSGVYTCVATNSVGKAEKHFDLNVLVPPIIVMPNTQTVIKIGENVVIECQAKGNPPPSISWLKDNRMLSLEKLKSLGFEIAADDQQLIIHNANLSHAGRYTCLASNEAGATEKDVDLEVIAPPLMAKLPAKLLSLKSLLNDPVKIECPVISGHVTEIKWLKSGTPLDPTSDPFLHISSDGRLLQLIHARENDSGQYQCIASNEAGHSSYDFQLEILVPPKIESPLGDGSGPNYVTENHAADFECYVSGNPHPTVSWWRDGQELERSTFYNADLAHVDHLDAIQLLEDGQHLHIPSAQVEDTGQYSCIANSSSGMRQRDFYLSVRVPPKINPSLARNVTANLHHPATLHCPILRGIPDPEVTWIKNGLQLNPFTDTNLEITNKGRGLRFQRSKLSDAGKYTCLAINSAGKDEESILLSVHVGPKIDHSNIGGPTTVIIDQTLMLECPTIGHPSPVVEWFKDGQLLNEEYYGDHLMVLQNTNGSEIGNKRRFQLSFGGQTLRLNKVQLKDDGIYECIATNSAGQDRAKYEVDVLVPPSAPESSEAKILQVTEGQSIALPCTISGDPQPNIIWLKDGQMVDHTYELNGNSSLHLFKTQASDTGRYTCLGTNVAGSVELDLDLEVLVPPNIQAVPDSLNIFIVEGSPLTLECQPSGIPFPEVSWLQNDREIHDQSDERFHNIQLLHNNQRLHLEGAKLNHSGSYTCVVENSVGVAHHGFLLHVITPPRFNDGYLESNYTGLLNENITLDCPVTGIPQPRILWYKESRMILSNGHVKITNNGTKLTISNVQLSDIGRYTCLASNEAGSKDMEMVVDVLVPPSIEGSSNEPEFLVVVAQESSVLECRAKGIPPPTITWLQNDVTLPVDLKGRIFLKDNGKILEIIQTLPQDDNMYTCIAENEAGAAEKDFRLDVIVPPGIDLAQPVKFLQAITGNPLAIECPVKGDPLPKVTWLKNGHPLEASNRWSILKKGQVAYLESALSEDAGDYSCLAANEAGNSQREFVLQIHVPPTIADSDSIENVPVIAYHFLRLECPASGIPQPDIIWHKAGEKLNVTSSFISAFDFQLALGSALQVHRAMSSHSGIYTCEAINVAGNAQKSFNVSVWRAPMFLGDFIAHAHISRRANSSVLLSCLSDGLPHPMVSWYKNDQPLMLSYNDSDNDVASGHELTLPNVDVSDSGLYRCVANNIAGNASKEFTLNVMKPPAFEDKHNAHIRAIFNERIDLPCHAAGTPNPRISWSRLSLSLSESISGQHHYSVGSTLTFPMVRLQDEGVYMCTATNNAGAVSRNITLEVHVPPSISEGPSDIAVIRGQDAVLGCHTKGRPLPKVIWKKDSETVENGGGYSSLPDGSLLVSAASMHHAGTYTCVAVNDAGSKQEQRHLRVHEPPQISTGQQQRYVTIRGQDATLECSSTGHPPPNIMWERNGEAIDLGHPSFSLLSNGGLLITSASSSDMGTYRCVVQNVAGKDIREVELIVMIPPKIELNNTRKKHFIPRGFSARLPCRATGYPFPTISWLRDGVLFDADVNGDLHLEQIKVEDAGKYICRATNDAGRDHTEILIEVHVPPTIISPPNTQQIALGGRVQFMCGADGIPQPTIVWLHNDIPINGASSTINGKSILTLEVVQFDDAGKYTCLASSVAGEKRANAQLTILVPPRIIRSPGDHAVHLDTSFVLSCDIEGDPYPSIFWTKNGQRLEIQATSNDGYLFLDKVQPTDAGIYSCIATNAAGVAESSGFLTVLVKPEFTIKPHDTVVELGTSGILDCQAKGDPAPIVQWSKDGNPINVDDQSRILFANSSLQLIAVQLSDEGVYECLAENSLGRVTVQATVAIMVHGLWSSWGSWELCSATCGQGVQTRHRTCDNPTPRQGGHSCNGPSLESRPCLSKPCPVNGAWSEWQMWQECSASCGKGIRVRTHACDAPAPANGGLFCIGDTEEIESCFLKDCPVNGGWGSWSHWMSCSVSCGNGTRRRSRVCNNPLPQHGGQDCVGNLTEIQPCISNMCEVHGEWGSWGVWSACSQSCGGGVRERSRLCDSPAPRNGGRDCAGQGTQTDYCHNDLCPIHGNWGPWADWGECSVSCNGGQRRRFRVCNNPSPNYGGRTCAGPGQDTEACNTHQCPEHGGWAPWSEWSPCSATCDGGVRQRYRSCTNPPPKFGGRRCTGDDSQEEQCAQEPCQGIPVYSVGNLLGAINGQDIGLSPITANITQSGTLATITATIGNLPPDAANWLRALPSLVSPIYWTLAREIGQAANGYTLTKGYFLRDSQVAFTTGEIVKMTHVARGLDATGAFLVDVVVGGDVPDFPLDEDIILDKYTEDYVQTGPDSLNAMSIRTFQMSGYTLPYAWNHSIHYDEINGRMPYLVQRLHVDDIKTNYNEVTAELEVVVSAAISKGSPSNRCPDGYVLHSSSIFCEDEDECAIKHPCSHGCSNTPGSFVCFCPTGYTLGPDGQNCQDVDECQLGLNDCYPSECENTIGSFRCLSACGLGFQRTHSGLGCQDINECAEQPEVCDQLCLNLMGGYRCDCITGYRLIGGATCKDIDECEQIESPCSHDCLNTPGSYVCSCPVGYNLIDNISCEDEDECLAGTHNCNAQQECQNTEGSFVCANLCARGFIFHPNGSCIDVDECRLGQSACHFSQSCENTVGSYRCTCPRGFQAQGTGQPCKDIDECQSNPNPCSYRCRNTRGDYECICPPGQKRLSDRKSCAGMHYSENNDKSSRLLALKSGSRQSSRNSQRCAKGFRWVDGWCKDYNECATEGQCQHICENTIGSYKCICPFGYTLSSNGRTCQDIDECTEEEVDCGREKVCFNTRGSFQCIDAPCPPLFEREKLTGDCVLPCDRSEVPCPPGVKYAEILAFKRVSLASGIQAFQDLLRLVAYDQDGQHMPYTEFRITENESGVPFQIRSENGKGILYTVQSLDPGREYRAEILATSYDASHTVVHYTTKFLVVISVAEFPY